MYAAEDIFTADDQKDADGNRTKYYSKGDLVATLTTGKDGKAVAKNLPLGQYRVVEVTAPDGYVLNPNESRPVKSPNAAPQSIFWVRASMSTLCTAA